MKSYGAKTTAQTPSVSFSKKGLVKGKDTVTSFSLSKKGLK